MDVMEGVEYHGKPTLETILSRYPIRSRLNRFLSTRDILRLSETSWSMRRDLMQNEWNINNKLRPFLNQPLQFRSKLGQCDALISGSFAMQFFDRVVWRESDLDIMVADGEQDGLAEFLTAIEGYTMTEEKDSPTYNGMLLNPYIIKCRTYMYRVTGDKDLDGKKTADSKVQLIMTSDTPLEAILSSFYTTAIVNFITWNKAYSIFPRATFLDYETAPLKSVNTHYGRLHSKYSKRGWRMRTEPIYNVALQFCPAYGKHDTRRIGGKDTWIIRLDTTSVGASPRPDFVIEYSQFNLRSPDGEMLATPEDWYDLSGVRQSFRCAEIRAVCFRSPSLKHIYVMPKDPPARYHWVDIGDILAKNTLGQLTKLGRRDVNKILDAEQSTHIVPWKLKFDPPEGWDYHDDLIPRYFKQKEAGNRADA
ncbi:hypothetical protein M426DRAFT_12269 [Hypoxylon sp. CI-4A]|nr:hypothetical protein M426DRAFT_12269 [Hypoxylon sp. CI-4A]